MRRTFVYWIAVMFMFGLLGAFAAPAQAEFSIKEKKEKPAQKKDKDEGKKSSDSDDDDDEASDDAVSAKKSDKEDDAKKKKNPVKKLIEVKIDQNLIAARMLNIPLPGKTRTVRDLCDRFDQWAEDEEVGAILLDLDMTLLSIPDVEEVRAAIGRLQTKDKKVVAYLNGGDPMSYLLACSADEIACAPTGSLTIPGLGRLFAYMRGFYQLRGIEYDVITAGKYKYPGFMNRREPDKYFQEEFGAILDGWFEDYVRMIAEGRKMKPEKVRELIDIALFDAEDAKNRGLVDSIAYYDDFADRTTKKLRYRKVKEYESPFGRITSIQDFLSAWGREIEKAQDRYKEVGPKIAILNARGPIIDVSLGASMSSSLIMRDEFVKTIEEIRKNKTIKAVVLRIDSPGGSGYASDIIWRKLRELDEVKPVVVSMGSVAGSGGYYIACPGRLIFAEPTTITGSIGVLAIMANQASMINRMDVNVAEMARGKRSLLGTGHRDMAPEDREFIQKYILDFYEIFLDRVAAGRKMPKDEVRKIAEGRIYTGRQAMEIGLVDRLGGLQDAIAAAREFANIPASAEIKRVDYPRPATFGELFESFSGIGLMGDIVTQAQQPAPFVSFDSQAQYFSRAARPLCWMAVPETDLVWGPTARQLPTVDLMKLLTPDARLLPAAIDANR